MDPRWARNPMIGILSTHYQAHRPPPSDVLYTMTHRIWRGTSEYAENIPDLESMRFSFILLSWTRWIDRGLLSEPSANQCRIGVDESNELQSPSPLDWILIPGLEPSGCSMGPLSSSEIRMTALVIASNPEINTTLAKVRRSRRAIAVFPTSR